tara:strand:+ start:11655 stop:12062 length:408 start_codon:yes stop_codon:yes gene_type:complete
MFGMIFLSCLVVIILYASRIMAIYSVKRLGGNLEAARHADEFRSKFPKPLRYITDNYNHIFEQPTLFYATVIYIFLMGHSDSLQVILAWFYVGLRAIHTIIQMTFNDVSWRIAFFFLSGFCLIVMILKEFLFFLG